MISRRQKRILVFISSILLVCVLTIAIANPLRNRTANDLWQYNWAKSQQRIVSFLVNDPKIHLVSDSSSGELTYFRQGDRYKYGYIDDKKEIVVPAVLDSTASFAGNYASVKFRGKYGIIDREGNAKTPFIYNSESFIVNLEQGYIYAGDNHQKGVVDLAGNVIIPLQYDEIDFDLTRISDSQKNSFSREEITTHAIVSRNGKQGILNIKNNTFIAIEGDELNGSLLDRGYVVFARQGREGIADLTGKIIIPAKFHI
ncbi:MAG: WG repeat-containing protein, partial [Pleurocapsa sp.]